MKPEIFTQDGKAVSHEFSLPFNGIRDLTFAYEKILAAHKKWQEEKVEKLKANNISYTETYPYGLIIDISTVPEGVKLLDLLNDHNKHVEKVYGNIGVIKYQASGEGEGG